MLHKATVIIGGRIPRVVSCFSFETDGVHPAQTVDGLSVEFRRLLRHPLGLIILQVSERMKDCAIGNDRRHPHCDVVRIDGGHTPH